MSANWRQGGGFRPKSNYWQKNDYKGKRKHQYTLEPGVTGFLCTCVGKFKERECVRDAYNILNEYADQLFGPEVRSAPAKESEPKRGDDVDESLKEEIASLKKERDKPLNERRFQALDSGANGIVFIKTTVPDPVKLSHEIVSTTAESKVQKSMFLLRLLPVEAVCYANLNDITKAAEPLFDKYFTDGGKTFSIVFSHRNNDRLSRDDVIDALATLVCAKNPTNKADLKAAQLAVLVEVIRGICCISVMPDYFKLKKYNILELCNVSTQQATQNNEEADESPNAIGAETKSSGNKDAETKEGIPVSDKTGDEKEAKVGESADAKGNQTEKEKGGRKNITDLNEDDTRNKV